MVKRRAFLLLTSLLLGVVLLLLGMGFISSQADRYGGVKRAAETAQARALAIAGLEDARVKIQNDIQFPPPMAAGQTTFSYGEVLDLGDPPILGHYNVVIETAYNQDPTFVLLVTSTGSIGDPNAPDAQYRIRAEMDMNPAGRYCHFSHWEDDGAP